MNFVKFWWKTRILKEVVYKPNGRPYDCKGLRFKGSDPFGKETEYYITDVWDSYKYLGMGKYTTYRSFHTDKKHPYVYETIRKDKDKFNKIFMKQRKVNDL